ADLVGRFVAADTVSQSDQAPVQPARVRVSARQRARGRRVAQKGRGRTWDRSRARRGVGAARCLAAGLGRFSACLEQASPACGSAQYRSSGFALGAMAVAELLRTWQTPRRRAPRARP